MPLRWEVAVATTAPFRTADSVWRHEPVEAVSPSCLQAGVAN